jgi:hypothetical protein
MESVNREQYKMSETEDDSISHVPLSLTEHRLSDQMDIQKNKDRTDTSTKSNHFTNIDQSKKNSSHNDGDENDDDFGEFSTNDPDTSTVEDILPNNNINDDNCNDGDDFGKFATISSTSQVKDTGKEKEREISNFTSVSQQSQEKPDYNAVIDDDNDFGIVSPPNKTKLQTNDDNDDFGDFGLVSPPNEPNLQDDDDDDFGDFGMVSPPSEPNLQSNDDNDFGVVSPPTEQKSKDDGDDFAEVTEPNLKINKEETSSEPSSLENRLSTSSINDDDEFGQFDSAPTKASDGKFTNKSSDNGSKGFANFSTMVQTPTSTTFSTTNVPQSFSNTYQQSEDSFKVGF